MIETIPSALDGERLDRIVAMMTARSRTEAADVIASGRVLVDGAVSLAGKVRLQEGQTVEAPEIDPSEKAQLIADPSVVFEELYVDEHVIVVNKPQGLVVHPGHGHTGGTLVNGLLARYPDIADVGQDMRPGIVHRLDKGTSGLMVVARTEQAYEHLIDLLSVHDVTRRYVALVWGSPEHNSGTIDAPIGRRPNDPLRMAIVADGKQARTTYEVSQRFREPKELSVVDCWLETGRTHQIRVHLTGIGHPVVGDPTYGRKRELPGADRPMLHAYQLAFEHPTNGQRVAFEAPIAPDMVSVIASCS